MHLRSLLFVPGDRPERFPKAVASGADAVILDLEDSVSVPRKAEARRSVRAWLERPRTVPVIVRMNPVDGAWARADLEAILHRPPAAIMLPKADGAKTVQTLVALAGGACPPILPIAGETAAGVFGIGSFDTVAEHLYALTWGSEDLSAAVGASTAREIDGGYTPPYAMVRSLTLFGAHAAGVPAIDTVYPDIGDATGLTSHVARARRDGFTGMLAIHPGQVAIINAGFEASDAELARARAIVACFERNPGSGALRFEGGMIDRPHLARARAMLAAYGRTPDAST